jgi:hypothetical protein
MHDSKVGSFPTNLLWLLVVSEYRHIGRLHQGLCPFGASRPLMSTAGCQRICGEAGELDGSPPLLLKSRRLQSVLRGWRLFRSMRRIGGRLVVCLNASVARTRQSRPNVPSTETLRATIQGGRWSSGTLGDAFGALLRQFLLLVCADTLVRSTALATARQI